MYKLCKTEQSAALQRELEQRLMALMNTCRYEEITVSNFCAYAGVPRKAFYRYFSSKDGALYALLDHTLLEYEIYENSGMLGQNGAIQNLEAFFQFWKAHTPLLDALKYSGLSGILMERAIGYAAKHPLLNRILLQEEEKTRDHILRFFSCGMMIMMVTWHDEGCRESPQEMAQVALRLLTQPLFQQ